MSSTVRDQFWLWLPTRSTSPLRTYHDCWLIPVEHTHRGTRLGRFEREVITIHIKSLRVLTGACRLPVGVSGRRHDHGVLGEDLGDSRVVSEGEVTNEAQARFPRRPFISVHRAVHKQRRALPDFFLVRCLWVANPRELDRSRNSGCSTSRRRLIATSSRCALVNAIAYVRWRLKRTSLLLTCSVDSVIPLVNSLKASISAASSLESPLV